MILKVGDISYDQDHTSGLLSEKQTGQFISHSRL